MAEAVAGKKIGIKENLFSLRTLLGFLVAAIVIYIFLRNFNFGQAVAALLHVQWLYLFVAFFVFYASLPLRGGRWGVLLKPAGQRVGIGRLSHYYFLSWFANALLPARIGDIYRAYLLKKNNSVPISLSLGVIFSERVIDLAVTAALVLLSGTYFWALLANAREKDYLFWGLLATGILVLIFVLVAIALPLLVRIVPEKWKSRLESFRMGIFKSPALFPIVLVVTVAIWLSEAMRLYLVFKAFGVGADFLTAVFISQASLILMSIPLSPAGLGLVELLMLKLLGSTGLSSAMAGALTVTDRLISYWSLLALGGIVYLLSPRDR